jgi:hypothetical protein
MPAGDYGSKIEDNRYSNAANKRKKGTTTNTMAGCTNETSGDHKKGRPRNDAN